MAVAGRIFGPEWRPYSDPATDFPVVRLTDPAFASGFTAPWQRQFTRHGELLYWSDRAGARQAFLMNLHTGDSRQITEADALEPASVSVAADDRGFVFVDGNSLQYGLLASERSHELYRMPAGASCTAVSVAANGLVFVAERAEGRTRIVEAGHSAAHMIRELPVEIDVISVRPRRPQLLYRAGQRLSIMNFSGNGSRDLRLAPGTIGNVAWTPSGRTLVYLHIPENSRELITLRENAPEDNSDRLIAKTSQFESVAANQDASVFVGASRSKASSYVLLLVRAVKRELALCEHHASDPAMVSPMFSPDSQSVYFASDRDGKPALYRVHVEKFVEETSEDR